MNAAEIAREYLEASNQRIEDDDTAPDITDADVRGLCRAVLDAEAYRARVERVALEMRNEHPSHARVVEWAAQLTGDRND